MERLIRIHTLSLSLEILVLLGSCLSVDNELIERTRGILYSELG